MQRPDPDGPAPAPVSPTHCRNCGARYDPTSPTALAWALDREPDGRRHRICPACARRHARGIEAKLAPEWWA